MQAIEEPPDKEIPFVREALGVPLGHHTLKKRMRLAEKRHRERMNEDFDQLAVGVLVPCGGHSPV
jgi:hypothetical protein